jgi:hypothetical protein
MISINGVQYDAEFDAMPENELLSRSKEAITGLAFEYDHSFIMIRFNAVVLPDIKDGDIIKVDPHTEIIVQGDTYCNKDTGQCTVHIKEIITHE